MADIENAPATTITTKIVGSNAADVAAKMEETKTVEVNGSAEVNGVCGDTNTEDNTEVKASKVAKLDDNTVETIVDDTSVKMEGTTTIVVNSTSEVNGVGGDTPENNTEVKTGKGEKLEGNDVKQENGNLVEKQPVVAVETNTEAIAETEGNVGVVIKKTEEPPQKDAAVENGVVEDASPAIEKAASVEKNIENSKVPLSEAAAETPVEEKSEPIEESKVEAATESEIETITGTEADKKD